MAKTGYANYKVPALTGKGTIKDTAISVAGSYAGALIDADGSTDVINIEGSTSINMVQPGYIYAKNSGTINVKNMLTVTGSASNGLTVELETGSKFNVLSGAKYTYKAPAPWSYFKVKNSTLTFDGPIVATNLSKNPYHAIELWHNSSLYLNSDNNIIDAEGSGLYAMAYGNGGRIEINGTTTINMKGDSSRQEFAFNVDNGNYNNPESYMFKVTDDVTITGLETYSGSYAISQADHIARLLDVHFYLDAYEKFRRLWLV